MVNETYHDLYHVQPKEPEIPIQEDCARESVPHGTTDMECKND